MTIAGGFDIDPACRHPFLRKLLAAEAGEVTRDGGCHQAQADPDRGIQTTGERIGMVLEMYYLVTWIASNPLRLGLSIAVMVLISVGLFYLVRGQRA